MTLAPRIIKLRRPPTVTVQEGPFVPERVCMDEVDRRWAAVCAAKPRSFDGRMSHVLGVHRNGHGGASIHVMDCAYRFFAVQDEQFDLGVRHLGVKGLTICDDRVLLGRRADDVMAYPGMWEFAPGGVLEPRRHPEAVLRSELEEETGIQGAIAPTPVAIVFDSVARCWELVYRLRVQDLPMGARSDEYSELSWCKPPNLPSPLSPPTVLMAKLLAGIDMKQ